MFQIKGNYAWMLLNKCVIRHKNVDIVKCIDIRPPMGPLFFQAENVFFRSCDGNHIYYWLNTIKFPNIQKIRVVI